jgi:serine/threonine protein kinase
MKKLRNPKWKIPENMSSTARSLFFKLVEMVPIQRYTAAQALNHPWILRREVKPPLTSFEKFKIYGELLKLKTIVFPVFFAAVIAGNQNLIFECRTEESHFVQPPVLRPANQVRQSKRGIATSTPDVALGKRPGRFLTPGKSTMIGRKMQGKEVKHSYLRKRV